jgi:hypothetical protein
MVHSDRTVRTNRSATPFAWGARNGERMISSSCVEMPSWLSSTEIDSMDSGEAGNEDRHMRPQANRTQEFEPLFPIVKDGKWGLINRTGHVGGPASVLACNLRRLGVL